MPRRPASRKKTARSPKRRKQRRRPTLWSRFRPSRLRKRLPSKRTRRRWGRAWRRLPSTVRWPVAATAIVALSLAVNGLYQIVRKPSELFFPFSGVLRKSPSETWNAYASLFEHHSTDVITPDLLASLAQVEGAGDPVARTYWRWAFDWNPFNLYQPASSSVGMYQISDGTFEQARRYCIHDHEVTSDGPWDHWESCWFNGLYTRVIPSHGIELTAAHLDRSVEQALRRHPVPNASLRDKQKLAALVHLCGAGAGRAHARRGLVLGRDQRCGTHDLHRYLAKVATQQAFFRSLATAAMNGSTD